MFNPRPSSLDDRRSPHIEVLDDLCTHILGNSSNLHADEGLQGFNCLWNILIDRPFPSQEMCARVIQNFNVRVATVIQRRGAWIDHVINY